MHSSLKEYIFTKMMHAKMEVACQADILIRAQIDMATNGYGDEMIRQQI